MSFKMFDHQKKGVDILNAYDSFGLFWEQGTGKTIPVIIHLSDLALSGKIKKGLWVAPKSALGALTRDFEKLRNNGLGYRIDAIEDMIEAINYEKISRKGSKWRKHIDETDYDFIVLDESHMVAKPTSNRTQYIVGKGKQKGLCSRIKYRYCLSGTPVGNARLEDYWSFLMIAKGGEYYPYKTFEMRYLKVKNIPGKHFKIIEGYQNEAELLDEVAKYSQSIKKEDCLDLPEKLEPEVIKVEFKGGTNKEFGKTAKQLYDEALENVVVEFDEVFDNPLVKTLRLRQIAAGHLKPNADEAYELNTEKFDYCLEKIQNNPNKTVVFYQFTSSFDRLTEMLDKENIPYLYLNGTQKDKEIWKTFQEKSAEECRVFIGHYQSASTGIDLYTATDTIYLEPTNSSILQSQSEDRTHRNGVKNACSYTFIVTKGTIEEDMYDSLRAYKDFDEKQWLERKMRELKGLEIDSD